MQLMENSEMNCIVISEPIKDVCVSMKSKGMFKQFIPLKTHYSNIKVTWKANMKNIHIRSKLLNRCQNVRISTKFVLGFLLPAAAWLGLCQSHGSTTIIFPKISIKIFFFSTYMYVLSCVRNMETLAHTHYSVQFQLTQE